MKKVESGSVERDSTSMPNIKCQNNLKDPKRAMNKQATFYPLSFSKYNGFQLSAKKKGHSLRLLDAFYSLPDAESTTTSSRVAKDSNKTGCGVLINLTSDMHEGKW